MNDVYKKDLYINPNIMFAFNREIIEYDIKEAGYSLTREYDLLPKKDLNALEKLDKHTRHIKTGIYQKNNKQYRDDLKHAFIEIRRNFFAENEVDENNLISIKKDAIFLMQSCTELKFGKYIEFRDKNSYSSYIRLPNGIELYYKDEHIDVKGIDDSIVPKHDKGIIDFLIMLFHLAETADQRTQLRFLSRFASKYKRYELPLDYYREFNSSSNFVESDLDNPILFDDYWEESKSNLYIMYNYFNVIIPIIKMLT